MIRIKLSEVREVAIPRPGMFDAFLRAGALKGEHLEISRGAFEQVQARFFPGLKLGTLVHTVLAPMVKAVDAVAKTHLATCGGCAGRELRLNAATHPPGN